MSHQQPKTISKEYLQQVCERYGIKPEKLSFIGGLENSVYAFQKNTREYFLRIGHSSHMSFDLVQAEIDWILYLAEANVPVVKPFASDNGVYIEKVDIVADTYFNVVAFEKAVGHHLAHRDPQNWHKEIIRHWGKIVGRMHALSKKYTPKSTKRYDFYLPPDLIREFLSHEEKATVERVVNLFQELEKFPKTIDSYGLVHSDLHTGNFFVMNNEITALLDFDRACYKWFISEIAVALYYPLYLTPLRTSPQAQKDFISYFLPLFWEGYESENHLKPFWKDTLNTFIQVRDAILFMYLPADHVIREGFYTFYMKHRIMGKDSYIDIQAI